MPLTEQSRPKFEALPDQPGVYLHKDAEGKVFYIGKAESLRGRVRQYFQATATGKARLVGEKSQDFDYIVTQSEAEALALERSLIESLKPRWNVRFRDDKQYPYICLTMTDVFPRPVITRRVRKDGNRYFGPYTSSRQMYQALRVLKEVFQLRSCSREIPEGAKQRLCLEYHIKCCTGPCASCISRPEYAERVRQACDFLDGKQEDVIGLLEQRMEEAAEELNFERAAAMRDQIGLLKGRIARQTAIGTDLADRDIIGVSCSLFQACAQLLMVRGGRIVDQRRFFSDAETDCDPAEVISAFLQQYYQRATSLPPEVLIAAAPEDLETLEQWLTEKRGARVHIQVPKRGEKLEMVQLATRNAEEALSLHVSSRVMSEQASEEALLALQEALELPGLPYRIEAYDISNIQGTDPVASMVVFEGARPKSADYRRFKLKTLSGKALQPDDFAGMREVIGRRLTRALKGDEKFTDLPDLILIDGGKGQLNAALEVMRALDVEIPMLGLAKRLEEVYLPERGDPLLLPRDHPGLRVLQQVRDEAHRYALTFHRKLRQQRATFSVLDGVAGIGPTRRDALLKHFGSVDSLKRASVDDVAKVPGMTRPAAERVLRHLQTAG
jgi:excinuclease ABC subunit C